MLISEVIEKIKAYSWGKGPDGKPIDPATTRDKILYGNPDQECTGIVTCIWATSDVIREAARLGCNLIVPHEALFWNHGDHTDWLSKNKVFLAKSKLITENNICVWRDHDYIHSGVPINGPYVDGIFYGLCKKLGWEEYLPGGENSANGFTTFEFPEGRKALDIAEEVIEKMGLNGVRIIGDPETIVKKCKGAPHIIGPADNAALADTEENEIDCLFSAELTDFTLSEYVRDSAQLGRARCIITIGHFNMEEPGMEYMVNWLPDAIGTKDLPIHFVSALDPFQYVVSKTVKPINQK